MVSDETVSRLRKWFYDYSSSFLRADETFDTNIILKREHSLRVCAEAIAIGRSLQCSPEQLNVAEIAALLHDVGRFEQFARYNTFMDACSENHALLGIRTIEKHQVIASLDPQTQQLIINAIANHNRLALAADVTDTALLFAQILRDADKLDILKIITDYYTDLSFARNHYMELGLPDLPEVSQEIIDDLLAQRIVSATNLKTLNDFKLLQMGWVYDINFPHTLRCVKERKYMSKFFSVLSHTDPICAVYKNIESYLERALN